MIIALYIYLLTITVVKNAACNQPNKATNKKPLIFKNCAPFTNCISRIHIAQVDEANHIHV